MSSRKILLNKLIQSIVEEWGEDEVLAAVVRASEMSTRAKFTSADYGTQKIRTSGGRLNAAQQVERTTATGLHREMLLTIAERFDRKQFLPSVADVRHFLMMTGKQSGPLKDRKDAFHVILDLLLDLSAEHMQQLLNTTFTTGPSQLGPISDAISSLAERLPRNSKLEITDEIAFGASEIETPHKEALKAVLKEHFPQSPVSGHSPKKG